MNAAHYEQIFAWLEQRPQLKRTVQLAAKGLPLLFAAAYGFTSALLFLQKDERLFRFLIVPAATLGSCLVLRRMIDAPRPYEVYGFQPLIARDKKGQSCPSNHTTSAVVIALAFLYLSPHGGWMMLPALLVALSRVVCGVHWPKDVLAGIVLAGLFGFLGLWII